RRLVERGEAHDHRQAANELRDEAEFEQVVVRDVGQELVLVLVALIAAGGVEAEANVVAGEAALDDLVEAFEGATADEEDVLRVNLQEVLVRMLAAALRGHVRNAAFDDLEQRLLDAFAGDIARDRRVVSLAG